MRSVLVAVLCLVSTAYADDQQIAQCILCHGANANGNVAIRAPRIAGMERWYLADQLEAFRSGLRGTHAGDVNGSEMRIVARGLKAADLKGIIDAVSRLPVKSPPTTIQGDASRGAALYKGCASCHGERGEGIESLRAPALARSNDWYLVAQLENFKDGRRGALVADTFGGPMSTAVLALPDAQSILDVVVYINTLR